MGSPSQHRLRRHPPNLSKKAKLFYSRYGRAIRALREQVGIAVNAIPGLSASQIRRMERGEYRVDSKIIVVLAKAHKLTPNEYLGFVANMLAHIPRRLASLTGCHSAAVLWIKIEDKTAAILKRQAKRRHLSVAKLSSRYVHEKIVEEEFPGIGFRNAFGGREAYARGHRMAVWEVVDLFRQAKTVSKTAEKLAWSTVLVWCTLKYANVFAAEVARQRKAAKPDRNFYLTEFILKQANERGDSARQKLVESEGGSLPAAEAARKLGISTAATLRRCQNGKLIAFRAEPKGPARFPVWQFQQHKVLPGLKETLKALNGGNLINDYGRMLFFLSTSGFLGGKRPLDCLRKGEIAKVLQAAQGYVE